MFTDVDSELRRLGAADYSISLFGGEFPGLANLEAGPLTASSMNHIKDASPGVKVNGIKKESNYNKVSLVGFCVDSDGVTVRSRC